MMRTLRLVAFVVFGVSGISVAAPQLYNYSSVVTDCTGTCVSFDALEVGATLTGSITIETSPGAAFGDTEVLIIELMFFNPALPPSGPVGDPVTDNPLVLDSELGIVRSNGTAGTVDKVLELDGGQLLVEFLMEPFSTNEAFLVLDLATGRSELCLFFPTAGCIPGATEALRTEGVFTLIPTTPIIVTPPIVDFGQLMVDEYTQTAVRIANSSPILEFGLIDGLEPPFFLGADSCSLRVDFQCNVTVSFLPTTPGAFADSFSIPSNHPDTPVLQVSVSGSTSGDLIFSDSFGD